MNYLEDTNEEINNVINDIDETNGQEEDKNQHRGI